MKIEEVSSRKSWDEFVSSREEANFLQSWDFYEFHRARGKKVVRRAVYQDEKIVAAYAGVIETAKRGKYLAVAGGPIMDFLDKKIVQAVFRDLEEVGKKEGCDFVRIRPQEPATEKIFSELKKAGFRKAPMYLSVEYAGILDLKKSEAEILAGASQGFRRKLRKAEKVGIKLTADASDEAIKNFCLLEEKHAKRQKYVAFSEDFLKKQFEAFRKNGEVLIYTARLEEEILAMNFMVFYGKEASYHYGVSSELGTKYSAAPLLHLKAMEEARRRGCVRYNLWGIVGTDERKHRFYGVSEFKRSFGVTELKYTPAHDLVLKPVNYLKTWVIETARRKIRHV